MGDSRLKVLEGTNGYAINGDKFLDIMITRQDNPQTCMSSEFWHEFHLFNLFSTVKQVFPQVDNKNYFYIENIGKGIEKRLV